MQLPADGQQVTSYWVHWQQAAVPPLKKSMGETRLSRQQEQLHR